MKIKINAYRAFFAFASTIILFTACKKSELSGSSEETTTETIAVAATSTTSATEETDSVYLMQSWGRGGKRDSIAQSSLPAAVQSYITINYAGASFHEAFAIKNSASDITGYVVIVYYNNKPVGLQFDSAGTFVKVLEQREKRDVNGMGHHHGGRFEHRDGRQRDTIALSDLPSSITNYFEANYASDTLLKAFKNHDSSVVVLSKNEGVFATIFDANGGFVKREELPSKPGFVQAIELAALPSVAANYLSQTYPNYVFEKGFSITQNGSIKGYVVFIDANNTKYAVAFNASGEFIKAKTVL